MALVISPECRRGNFGHAWEPIPPPLVYPFQQRWPHNEFVRCTRCTTERYRAFDTWLRLATRPRYVYPDGYRLGADTPTTEELRALVLHASMPRRKRRAA